MWAGLQLGVLRPFIAVLFLRSSRGETITLRRQKTDPLLLSLLTDFLFCKSSTMLTEYEHSGDESYVLSRPALWSTLLFVPFAVALICYIWAFCSQRHKLGAFREFFVLSLKRRSNELRGAQNLYHAAFCLLVLDGLTIICGLVWGILMLNGNVGVASLIFVNIWLGFRFFSLAQHMILALVSVIFLYRPKWADGMRNLSKGLYVIPFILIILAFRIDDGILIGVDVFNFLVMVAILVFCCLPASTELEKQKRPIGLLALAVYLLVCLPNTVFNCLMAYSEEYLLRSLDVLFITNFYIALSGFLFYLVFKLEEEDERFNQYECAIRSA